MRPVDQDIRDFVTTAIDRSIALSAGAGSGKTSLLASRVVHLLVEGDRDPGRVAAITFTEKAAGELEQRIRTHLERSTHARRHEALARFGSLQISTIHAFCRRLLIEEALDADWAPDTEMLPALFGDPAIASEYGAWRRAFEEAHPAESVELRRRASERQLREAAVALLGYRDMTPIVGPIETDWAAVRDTLRERVEVARAWRTNAPPGCTLTAKWDDALSELAAASVIGDPEEAVRAALTVTFGTMTGGSKKQWGEAAFESFKDSLKALRAFGEVVEAAIGSALHAVAISHMGAWLLPRLTETAKAEARAAFDDVLFRAQALLRDDAEVRARLNARYDAILIDEVQDTDPIQAEVASLLSRSPHLSGEWNAHAPEPGALFAVGDPKQSIYRFRRADVSTWGALSELVHPDGDAPALTQNFRSVPALVEWHNAVFEGLPHYIPQAPFRGAAAHDPIVALPVQVKGSDDAVDPAIDALVRHLLDLRRGPNPPGWADVMVLLPSWGSANAVQDALTRAGIPCVVEGGRMFFDRDEVKLCVMALRALEEPADAEAVVAVLRGLFGITPDLIVRHRAEGGSWRYTLPERPSGPIGQAFERLQRLHRGRVRAGWVATLDALLEATNALAVWSLTARGASALGNVEKVRALLRAQEAVAHASGQVVEGISDLAYANEDQDLSLVDVDAEAVRVTSLFKAKGLEAPVVVLLHSNRAVLAQEPLVDREAGQVAVRISKRAAPPGWEERAEADKLAVAEEQRRFMYVAATRARDQLVIVARHKPDGTLKDGLLAYDLQGGLPSLHDVPHDAVVDGVRVRHPKELPAAAYTEETFPGLDARVDALLAEPPGPEPTAGAWLTARKQAVREARRKSLRWRSVTERASGARGHGELGRAGGTVVHRVMEQLDLSRPDADLRAEVPALVGWFGRSQHLDAAKLEACREVVLGLLDHPVVERARRAPERWVEVPFALPERGGVVAGTIDLCFPTDATRTRWVVVDWKSHLPPDGSPLKLAYEKQLKRYAKAVLALVTPCDEVPETVLAGPFAQLADEAEVDPFMDIDPELAEPLSALLADHFPQPIPFVELGEEGAEPIALFDLAWPDAKVGLLRYPEDRAGAEAAGWRVVVLETEAPGWGHAAMDQVRTLL